MPRLSQPQVITRAVNDLQKRVKGWLQLHPTADQTLAIVSVDGLLPEPGFLYCGVGRDIDGLTGHLIYNLTSEVWFFALDDVEECIIGEFDPEDLRLPQQALLSITGMKLDTIAKQLGLTPGKVKAWFAGKTVIPAKCAKEIVRAFLHTDAAQCKTLRKMY